MNPILLKPSADYGSQVILQGKVFGQMQAMDYHEFKPTLKKVVLESYRRLEREYDVIVMEGAGSCCEMNLKANDLVNLPMAKAAAAPCLLVADIDRGGVFAQIIGSHHLMTKNERRLCAGFLINKFRGDARLFESGIAYIEKRTRKPVLGLIPFYHDIQIDPEDSVAVQEDKRICKAPAANRLNVAVLKLPAISNFTDMSVLEQESEVVLNYLHRPQELTPEYDLMILPGTKNVMEDAGWLGRSGWKKAIRRFAVNGGDLIGICGGYQLLGRRIRDPHGVESERKEARGLELLPVETVLEQEKVVRKVSGTCVTNGKRISGYEIHMGQSRILEESGRPYLRIRAEGERIRREDGCYVHGCRIVGTYVHGILDSPGFRGDVLNRLRRRKGLPERAPRQGRSARFRQYDRLADHFEAHCEVDRIIAYLRQGDEK
jgi:adenosylcobyric acid synthase